MLTDIASAPSVKELIEVYESWNNPLQVLISESDDRPEWVTTMVESTDNWSINSRTVLTQRYATHNPITCSRQSSIEEMENHNITECSHKETIPELYGRIAWAVSAGAFPKNESHRLEISMGFWSLMIQQKFMPNSPTQVNAGMNGKGCLSACFVVSPEDNMESIMEVATEAAMIEKWGGGIGFNFSKLRPRNDRIATTHGQACGPIAVMKLFSQVGATLTQGAFRLGAHMATLDVWHPDIRAFIHCKDDDASLQNFNISVGASRAFMLAVQNDKPWDLINPRDGTVVDTISAHELWDEIMESAWTTGDPGLIFVDTVADDAPNPHMGQCWPNPCGEQMLENHGSCNLGSLNLAKYIFLFDDQLDINWELLAADTRTGVRFLDAVVEINQFPLPILRETNLRTRRIGLGVMGWADMLIMLGISYDSDEALELADKVGEFIYDTAVSESENMAEEFGPFLEWENSAIAEKGLAPRRNSCLLSIAPTGTISRIADCGSGVEPNFANAWWSNILWKDQESASQRMLDAPTAIWDALRESLGDEEQVRSVLGQVADSPDEAERIYGEQGIDSSIFRTAMTISPESHVRMQAAWQKWITNGVSKTVNLHKEATVADIESTYMLAFQTGCKGVTIYRDGSKSKQVLETGSKDKEDVSALVEFVPAERPDTMYGLTENVPTGYGVMYVTVNFDPETNKPSEMFTAIGKAGGSEPAHLEGLSRMVSMNLRQGFPVESIVNQLRGITSEPVKYKGMVIRSAEDGIAKVLLKHGRGPNTPLLPVADAPGYVSLNGSSPNGIVVDEAMACPKCPGMMVMQEGCPRCLSCGHSKCG